MEKYKTIKPFESEYSWDNREKALIFYHSEEFKKKFTDIVYERFAFPVSSLQDLDSFITELYFSKYHAIYLDIDFIFCRLDEVLAHIRDKESKNKESLIHLVTSNKENYFPLKKFSHPKNILLLLEGKEIKYLIGGRKCIPKTPTNSSPERKNNNAC